MGKHLIKRAANLTDSGNVETEKIEGILVDIKLNSKPSGSERIKINDEIYLAESGYAIYGKAIINNCSCILYNGIDELLEYFFSKTKAKNVDTYFYSKLKSYHGKVDKKSKFYVREIELIKGTHFDTPFLLQDPFLNPQQTYFELTNEFNLENTPKINEGLILKIPGSLRKKAVLDYNIDTKKFAIDIDHHVPKSVGGPGNIIENLIPMGPSYNRAKSDSIPSYLFKYAYDAQIEIKIPKKLLDSVSPKIYTNDRESKKLANEIVLKINEDYETAKKAYQMIKEFHFPNLQTYISNL